MTLQELQRLLRRNWLLLTLIPAVTAVSVFLFARNQDKKYTSDTTIYTGITSGFKIEGDNNSTVGGWNAASTAFDNLLSLIDSRDTKEEVCLRLIATRLMEGPAAAAEPTSLVAYVKSNWLHIKPKRTDEQVLDSLRTELKGQTLKETTANVMAYYRANTRNPLYKLINSKSPRYSEKALANLVAYRLKDSDLLKMEYTTTNPELCRQTLEILTQVFIRKHRELFSGQNESVVGYFDKATKQAYNKLQAAEQKLLAFHQQHNIVDYDKQILTSTDEKQLTADKYNNLAMQYAGATSTLKSVEGSLSKRGGATLKSQEIIRLRNRLSDLSGQITELELLTQSNPSPENTTKLASLKKQAEDVTTSIGNTVSSYYADSHSMQGVPAKDMLQDYSKSTLQVEDLKSQLNLMRQQKQAFSGEYNRLVPLGAEIRKIRREVEVAEKEYMSQMEGLKQSRLSQQNVELASKLKVVDPPNLPDKAGSSRLLLLLLGGLIGSFMFTGAGLVAADMLNTSLQKPSFVTKVTSFPVLGIIPKTTNRSQKQLQDARRAEDQLARQLLLKLQQKPESEKPFLIGVLSSQSGEGKTAICNTLTNSLNSIKIKTVSLLPNDHAFQEWTGNNCLFYSPLQGLTQGVTVADLAGTRIYNNSVIIVEFPALLEATYPASLLQNLDLMLVAVRADRTWHQSDRTVFENIQAVTKAPLEIVLNGVLPEYVTEFIGARAKASGLAKHTALLPHPGQALLSSPDAVASGA